MHVIVHRVFEQSDPEVAVVEHRFRGRTRDAAWRAYLAHWDGDAHLRACAEEGYYESVDGQRVPCTVQWWWEEERDAAPQAASASAGYAAPRGQPLYYSPRPVQSQASQFQASQFQAAQPARGFVPRVIEGGRAATRAETPQSSSTGAAPPGCDAATGA